MADPVNAQIQAAAMTPGRTTTVTFDIAEVAATEPYFHLHRETEQVQAPAANRTDLLTLQSGAIVLKPVNDISTAPGTTTADGYVLRLSHFTAASILSEVPRIRKKTELPNIGASASLVASGDYYLKKRIAASVTDWDPLFGTTPSVYSGNHYPMDRVCHSTDSHSPNMGYLLKFVFPGSYLQNPDFIFGFEFGGDLTGTGFGHYYLSLSGDGKAQLYEYVAAAWTKVANWNYNTAKDMVNASLAMRILPYAPRQIEFHSETYAYSGPGDVDKMADSAWLALKAHRRDTSHFGTFTHTNTNRAESTLPGGRLLHVTGPGKISCDVRRDLLCSFQVSRLGYPESGELVDQPFKLPYGVGASHVVRVFPIGYNYDPGSGPLTSITGTLENADGTALAAGSEATTWRGAASTINGYTPPGGTNALRARITLTNGESAGSRFHTPVLWAYEALRYGHGQAVLANPFTGGKLQNTSISGPSYEPDHESAGLVIEDEKNELALLRARGQTSLRVETTYDAADPTKKCILFEGYTGRVNALRKGKNGFTYPSQQWRMLDIEAAGKWQRLQSTFFMQGLEVAKDLASPAGSAEFLPWKVTDIIRVALKYDGFDEDQLDIPDDDIRIFISPDGGANNFRIPPGTVIPDLCQWLAVNYLNAFFVWDANARPTGATTQGMWRLLRPPTGTETPLWTFTTAAGTAGYLQHRAGAYGSNTSPVLGVHHEFKSYIIPPEGNVLTVVGAPVVQPDGTVGYLSSQFVNPTSFDSPTHGTADPNHIDYIGYIKPIEYIDHTIGQDHDLAKAQATLDFIARRVYNLACRGRKWFQFTAELVLVTDTGTLADGTAAYTNPTYPKRPLRPGDLVTLDGELCVIHGANPTYDNDILQTCRYEAELFRFENTYTR